MKRIAYILAFVFSLFVAGPTIVTCIDKDADVSFAFTANEEENSSKHLLNLEFIKDEHASNQANFLYLRKKTGRFHYAEDHHQVYLDVLSPPPRHV